MRRLYGIDVTGCFKDGINDYIVRGDADAVSIDTEGTKCACHYQLDRCRPEAALASGCACGPPTGRATPFADFDRMFADRIDEADEFYAALQQRHRRPGRARWSSAQAFAGMLWSKQFYYFDVPRMARRRSDPARRRPPSGCMAATPSGAHLNNADIISMPDNWEYPWYAAWDLAFHCVALRADRPGIRQGAAACC